MVSGLRMYRFNTFWAPDSRNTSRTKSFRLSTSGAIFRLWSCNFLAVVRQGLRTIYSRSGGRLRDSCLMR